MTTIAIGIKRHSEKAKRDNCLIVSDIDVSVTFHHVNLLCNLLKKCCLFYIKVSCPVGLVGILRKFADH